MKLLMVGSGGREHAICWKLSQDTSVDRIFAAPGNPGMEWDRKIEATGIPAGEFAKIAAFVKEKEISFVVVGPDQALADGIVDFLEERGIPTFGPTSAASKIEWSKAYSKELMVAAGIPTAGYQVFEAEAPAKAFLETATWGNGWVIKADGLALGKGVVVCESREQAVSTVGKFFSGSMGAACKKIVVEERLLGREVSAFFLCDGECAVPLGMACDYKRIFDGDEGPNTGGMGAFTPADWLPEGFLEKISRSITKPLLAEMKKRKNPFKGMLFVGLMVEGESAKVLEFNARFGDPETQALMPMLDENLLPWLRASRDGKLDSLPLEGPAMKNGSAVHLVLAAKGYPGTPVKGDEIRLDPAFAPGSETWRTESVKVFFAGVAKHGSGLCTNGGRVLGITALAKTRTEARKKVYEWAGKLGFNGQQRRTDVGL